MGRDDDEQVFRDAMRELGLGERGRRSQRDDGGAFAAEVAAAEGPERGAGVGAPAAARPRDAEPDDRGRRAVGRPAREFQGEDEAFLRAMGALTEGAVPEAEEEPETAAVGGRPAHGTPRTLVRRIRSGALQAERVLDLHGRTRDEARAALRSFIGTARADGVEVVKIITGRGLHSVGDAVLQSALPGWLRSDLREAVREVVKAPPGEGGDGALFVFLLRRT